MVPSSTLKDIKGSSWALYIYHQMQQGPGHQQQQQQQHQPQVRQGYFSHGDVAWPFLYMGIMGGICSLGVLPWWLILLVVVPVYIGGVQIVIVKGALC